MQLPTSIAAYSSTNSTVTNRSVTRNDTQSTGQQSTGERVANVDLQSQQGVQQQAQVEKTSTVEQAARSELSAQDLTVRTQASASSPVNQYQQVAAQESSNAQSQDPSLFRVDVYV